MITLWHFYWPVVAIGVVIGAVIGSVLYNRMVVIARDQLAGVESTGDERTNRRRNIFWAGLAGSIAAAVLWHWPLGAGGRLADQVEAAAAAELSRQEMSGVTARLEKSPLRRGIVLSGRADDFQQAELTRIIDDLPGVSGVRWATPAATVDEAVR